MEREVVGLLEASIQAAPGSIGAGRALAELDGWDSMGMVSFVGEVFDRLGVEIGVDELESCRTVGDLVALVQRKAPAR